MTSSCEHIDSHKVDGDSRKPRVLPPVSFAPKSALKKRTDSNSLAAGSTDASGYSGAACNSKCSKEALSNKAGAACNSSCSKEFLSNKAGVNGILQVPVQPEKAKVPKAAPFAFAQDEATARLRRRSDAIAQDEATTQLKSIRDDAVCKSLDKDSFVCLLDAVADVRLLEDMAPPCWRSPVAGVNRHFDIGSLLTIGSVFVLRHISMTAMLIRGGIFALRWYVLDAVEPLDLYTTVTMLLEDFEVLRRSDSVEKLEDCDPRLATMADSWKQSFRPALHVVSVDALVTHVLRREVNHMIAEYCSGHRWEHVESELPRTSSLKNLQEFVDIALVRLIDRFGYAGFIYFDDSPAASLDVMSCTKLLDCYPTLRPNHICTAVKPTSFAGEWSDTLVPFVLDFPHCNGLLTSMSREAAASLASSAEQLLSGAKAEDHEGCIVMNTEPNIPVAKNELAASLILRRGVACFVPNLGEADDLQCFEKAITVADESMNKDMSRREMTNSLRRAAMHVPSEHIGFKCTIIAPSPFGSPRWLGIDGTEAEALCTVPSVGCWLVRLAHTHPRFMWMLVPPVKLKFGDRPFSMPPDDAIIHVSYRLDAQWGISMGANMGWGPVITEISNCRQANKIGLRAGMCLRYVNGEDMTGLVPSAVSEHIRMHCQSAKNDGRDFIDVVYVLPRDCFVRLKNLKKNGFRYNGAYGAVGLYSNGHYDVDLGKGIRVRALPANMDAAGEPLPQKRCIVQKKKLTMSKLTL